MDNIENNDELEINISDLLITLKENIRVIIICFIIGVLVATTVTVLFMDKKYSSTSRIYLKPEVSSTTGQVDYSSVNSNNLMVNNYIAVMKSESITSSVAEKLSIDNSIVANGLSVTNESDTQIIVVTSTTTDPELSKQIVENTVNNFFDKMKSSLSITNMEILDAAKANSNPVSPNRTLNMIIGGLLGAMVCVGYIFVTFIMDNRIKSSEEAEKYFGIPVLGAVPDKEQ